MDKKDKGLNFSCGIPAEIVPVEGDENLGFTLEGFNSTKVTPARVKIFYKGTTPDGRVFTEEFAESLLENLEYTPVVGQYDEYDGDFWGHGWNQNVYGMIPDKTLADYKFETIMGQRWLTCNVLLFTGRNDSIGEAARKIIGKAQSLELDPETVEYTLNRKGNSQEIIFQKGEIIGLSVLGDYQSPGFPGSSFFNEEKQEFEQDKFLNTLREINAQFKNIVEKGGEDMKNYSKLLNPKNFSEQDGETNKDLLESFAANRGIEDFEESGAPVVEITDAHIVYSCEDKTYLTNYTKTEEGFTFTEAVEVEFKWVEVVVEDSKEEFNEEVQGAVVEPIAVEEPATENHTEIKAGQEEPSESEGEDNAQENYAALDSEEKEELAQYRRASKKATIAKYAEFLTKEKIEEFTNTMDNFTVANFDKEVAYASVDGMLAAKNAPTEANFQTILNANSNNAQGVKRDELKDLIDKYK